MSQCPFAQFPNMIDPSTYEQGMPYEEFVFQIAATTENTS